jgi:hypothetical protein
LAVGGAQVKYSSLDFVDAAAMAMAWHGKRERPDELDDVYWCCCECEDRPTRLGSV